MKTISFCSVKGGTGKSTLSIVTALSLRRQGFKVLFIDLDPQNSATFFFSDEIGMNSIFKVLMGDKAEDHILHTDYGIDLIPSDLRLLDCKTIETIRLKKVINQVTDNYDFCIIDTAPTYDNLTINTYNVADTIIIPSTMDAFSCKTVHFLLNKFEELELNKNIGIALNMFVPSKNENKNTWSNREASLFFDDDNLKDYLVNATVPRSNTLHRIIAEPGYSIKGTTAKKLFDFVSEITGEQLTIDFIGGIK